jgi:hypothetical protein
VCDDLSEQIFDLQTSSITDSDVRPDSGEVSSSPPALLSPAIVPSLSSTTSDPGLENSRVNPLLIPKASLTTPSSTPESYSGTSNESTQFSPDLVATGQASTPIRSSVKACGLCQKLFNGSEQLL